MRNPIKAFAGKIKSKLSRSSKEPKPREPKRSSDSKGSKRRSLRSIFSNHTQRSGRKEEENDYGKGGFHPVRPGDTFCQRYTIVRKLGFGRFSTVWLASDANRGNYVALKILKSRCCVGEMTPEAAMLWEVSYTAARSQHPGAGNVLPCLNHFRHAGPNGFHDCFVFEPMGGHMYDQTARYPAGRLPTNVVKSVTRQILLALDFLHRQ
ncbi:hypothetical protein KEM55_000162, partial [Ascosphaera atra]